MNPRAGLVSRAALLFLALFALASALRADDHPNAARGFQADKVYQVGDADNIDLFSGSLTLTLPIGGSYSAAGSLTYSLTLVFGSNVWNFGQREDAFTGQTYQQATPHPHFNSGLGWLLGLGRVLAPFDFGNDTERWVYQGPDGAERILYATLHVGDADEPGENPLDYVNQRTLYTRDSTYLKLKRLTAGGGLGGPYEIEFPNGQIHRFDSIGRLTQIADRFGNALNVTYGSLLWTLTDTQGRTHRVYFQNATQDNQPIQVVQRVELAAFGGAAATYFFNYASVTIGRGCENDPLLADTVQVPLLTSVSLPDGSSYQMPVSDYVTELTSSSPLCKSSGILRGLTLPTLGRLEWDYQSYVYPAGQGKIHWQDSAGVATRRTKNAAGTLLGTWTYVPNNSLLDPSQVLRTVTDPLGHRTEHYFVPQPGSSLYSLPFNPNVTDGAGRFLSTRTYNAAGTLLRTTYVLYEHDRRPEVGEAQERYQLNRREKSSRTQFHDDGNRVADLTRADFDGLGHYRTETTGGNFGAGDVRTATVSYNPARGTYVIDPATNQPGAGHTFTMWPSSQPWVLGTFESRRADEAGQTAFSRYCFDANTGFLLRQRTLKNSGTTESASDVLAVFIPDAAGNVQTEQSFGGDTQGLATGNTCGMALPAPKYRLDHTYQFGTRATSQYSGASFLSLDQTIDGPSGLPVQSRDVSGIATDYEYDLLGRLTWVKPAAGNNDGWTEYVYTRAFSSASLANVLVRRRNNGSKTAAVQAQSQIFFDALGRVWQEKQLLPSGLFNVRETFFDGAGNKASVSELQTGTPNRKTQFLFYDPFGRATTIRPPDGSAHDVTLNYFGVRVVERTVKIATAAGIESAATTTETYDRQGRLSSAKEPSGAGDALVTTTYSYDVGNRLRQVQTTSGGVTQNRFFTYDQRGFLNSETHPEKGASGNGTVSYLNYDARGHAGRKIDGPSDLTFLYDSAERLTLVRETGTSRTLKSFTYAGANGNFFDPILGTSCFDLRKGKLTQQSRFNYVAVNGGAITVELREGLTYCGREGRLSRRSLENWVNGGLNETFFLPNVTYNALGDITSLDYPRCTHAACSAPAPRTVTSSYTNGFLTAVGIPGNPGAYAGSLTYHPNLMVHQVAHANSLTDTYANDPNSMRRPGSITVTEPGGAVRWATGDYLFDGAGNVKAIGTHSFLYDKVSRVKTANLYLEPTTSVTLRTQSYTFDAFGNLQSVGGDSARNTPTSSATNRLTGGGYDAAGNLTGWNFNTYQYDPFNLMWDYRTGTGEEWIYLYTADDERAWSYKTDNTSLWTLRGPDGKVLREYTAGVTWTVNVDNIYRDGSLLAAETPQGTRHFHLDHLGTPRLVTASGASTGGDFYTLTPCRVIDTRDQAAPIGAFETRIVPMAGACGIPAGASAVSVNLTVVGPSTDGDLTAFPANEPRPTASAISYRAGIVRANNGVLKLGNGALAFFANQPSGSVHLIVDVNGYFMEEGAGAVVAYHIYYPFGEEATAFNQDTIRAKFTGHERDLANLGGAGDDLDYMHARHCSPLTGRFLSFDPVGGNPRAPQSWNRYSYVMNRPLLYTDPAGLFAMPVHSPPPAGMTLEDWSYAEGMTVLAPAWRGTNNNPNTGLWGANYLAFSSGFMNFLSSLGDLPGRGIVLAREHVQNRFEQMAVEGNDLAAFIDYLGLEVLIPEDSGDLGVDLAMAFIPGGKAGKGLFKGTDALRRHNKTVKDVVKALKLTKDQRQILHREIHGMKLTYHEILQMAKDLFKK